MENKYSLTAEDKKYLLSIGTREKDFDQIQEGLNNVKIYRYDLKHPTIGVNALPNIRPITIRAAIRLCGKEAFLAGMDRATFHWSSAQLSKDRRYEIGFDLNDWWRKVLDS